MKQQLTSSNAPTGTTYAVTTESCWLTLRPGILACKKIGHFSACRIQSPSWRASKCCLLDFEQVHVAICLFLKLEFIFNAFLASFPHLHNGASIPPCNHWIDDAYIIPSWYHHHHSIELVSTQKHCHPEPSQLRAAKMWIFLANISRYAFAHPFDICAPAYPPSTWSQIKFPKLDTSFPSSTRVSQARIAAIMWPFQEEQLEANALGS